MSASKHNDKALCFRSGEQVQLLLPKPFGHSFTYRVAEDMTLRLGSYVSVPFGPRELVGVVWERTTQPIEEAKCKTILAHHDHIPPIDDTMRHFIQWSADYTLSPLGMILKMALSVPDALTKPPSETYYRLQHVEAGRLSADRKAVIEQLQTYGSLSATHLKARASVSSAVLAGMVKVGMLAKYEAIAAPLRPAYEPRTAPLLRDEQAKASHQVKAALEDGFSVFALEGVTGSGKTEVYFDVIESLLTRAEGQILVLLPEIALTTQWMQRFEARFGNLASLWHSSVSVSKRKKIWQAVALGTAPLVVGARSALYLPFKDLRLIIVDEEHEATYKQEEGVLYHARDMAVARAKHESLPILLCSATLSLETHYNILQGKYRALSLTERHGDYCEPIPQLIDLRCDKPETGHFIAPSLREALARNLAAGHQSLLFLNRRGYAPLLLCRSCGHRFACPNCTAWMIQHQHPSRLQCHHCDWRQSMPETCPECESDELVACGPGVERIAEEVGERFPEAGCVVLSSDVSALASQIEKVIAGDADIIIGTQMVAKGHHFPKLALVGIIDGDIGLDGGDLRASERCYQLMHQLAGRAGREAIEGKVYIQTTQPDHPLMQAIIAADREAFMAAELAMRETGGWPPYGRLAGLLLEGPDEQHVIHAAQLLMQWAPRYEGLQYLGPAPAPIARARNLYRYRILLKAPRGIHLQHIIREWLKPVKLPSKVKCKVDIDPYQFL